MARQRLPDLTQFDAIQSEAELRVASFRCKYGYPVAPPIPVELIARSEFGLRCECCRLGHARGDELGALSVDEGLILVDTRCTQHQFKFTVGHECGHWVLHEDNAAVTVPVDDLREIPITHLLGSMSARTKKERATLREVEANRFAAALLMPRPFLLREAEKHGVIDLPAVAQLARAFDVSKSAMLFRVWELSKYQEWNGPRIEWGAFYDLAWILRRGWHGNGRSSPGASPAFLAHRNDSVSGGTRGQSRSRVKSARDSEAMQAFYYFGRFSQGESPGKLSSRSDMGSSGVKTPRPHGDNITDWLPDIVEDLADVLADHFRKLKSAGQPEGELVGNRTAPVIIEMTGTPFSGKDTLIEIIKDYLEDGHGYRVRVIDEAIKFCHIDRQLSAERLLKTVAQTVAQLYEARFENPGDYDFVIFNRGLFDRLGFLRAMRVLRDITQEAERIHTEYLLSYARLQDMTFLFLISGEESLRRQKERARGSVHDLYSLRDGKSADDLRAQRILDRETLARLNESYLEMFGTCKEWFDNRIYLFDFSEGADASIIEKARALADATLPRNPSQLLLPELFGLYYACKGTSGRRRHARRRSSSGKARPEAKQLLLFGEPTVHGSVARGGM